ncbi:hypothetical protein C9374_014600 [Naegleria lovaniensis]|uniref:U-box domain-containing protein n=1 Tax=Naegleria lovaniensis TaxID=51637 RepID=A0AA88KMQ1_NAELO|nr:uncharacterized protein C9374_014600 [Naegleria lovaniensis]KAG2389200.1 hypothetical protein C9374_014600 [Naegleria lovaniensis]
MKLTMVSSIFFHSTTSFEDEAYHSTDLRESNEQVRKATYSSENIKSSTHEGKNCHPTNAEESVTSPSEEKMVSNSPSILSQDPQQPQTSIRDSNDIVVSSGLNNINSSNKEPIFILKKTIIGTRNTSILLSSNRGNERNNSLLLSLFNLITLRGATMDVPPNCTEISLEKLLQCLEKAFLDFNPKLKSCKIKSLLNRLYNTQTVDFRVTGEINSIENDSIEKLVDWVKIYFVHGTIIAENTPLYQSLKGMKYSELLNHSKSSGNTKKLEDIREFLNLYSDLGLSQEGIEKLHTIESMRLKILFHEDTFSVIVNYKGRIFELIDRNALDSNSHLRAKYNWSGPIPENAVWARWPLHNPSDKRVLCGGDFFELPTTCSPTSSPNLISISEHTEEGIDVSVLTCPISMCIFFDPVVAVDNITYEREVFKKWCGKKVEIVSPVTGKRISPRMTNDVVIRNKVKNYLERNVHLKLSEELYFPLHNFESFRKAIAKGDVDEATEIAKSDIRLITMRPDELAKLNDSVKSNDSLNGYNLAFIHGLHKLLDNMKNILVHNIYLAMEQRCESSTIEQLSLHLDLIEQKILDSKQEFPTTATVSQEKENTTVNTTINP